MKILRELARCVGTPRFCVICMGGLFIQVLAGCGNQSAAPPSDAADPAAKSPPASVEPTDGEPPSSAASAPTSPRNPAAGESHGRDEIWVDAKGQKWFGNVPYDVFFDQPLTVASNSTPVGGNPVAGSTVAGSTVAGSTVAGNSGVGSTAPTDGVPASGPGASVASTGLPGMTAAPVNSGSGAFAAENPPPAATESDGAAGANTWADLISATELDEEVKSIRNFMKENLQSVGNYNSSMLMIPPKAAALGVLAGVAMEHPEAVSWQEDAIYIRDLAKQMNADPLQRGAKDQKRLLGLFESIADTLNRSRPAGLPEPPASDSFADVSEMRLVMMRMEEAEKRMRTEAGSEGSFTSNKAMVQHEASMLATMTHTITRPGYGYEDDPEFVGYANAIVAAAKSVLNAAEAGDFATYEVALSKISTTCQSCHSQYKND